MKQRIVFFLFVLMGVAFSQTRENKSLMASIGANYEVYFVFDLDDSTVVQDPEFGRTVVFRIIKIETRSNRSQISPPKFSIDKATISRIRLTMPTTTRIDTTTLSPGQRFFMDDMRVEISK